MTKKNAPDLSSPSSPGGGSDRVGDETNDTDCSLEAPRRLRSEAQIAAFEKARTKRSANRAAAAPQETPAPSAPATPVAPPATPAAPAPAAKPRKTKTGKGKKRGHLVRLGTANATHEDPEDEYEPPRTGYMNFVIV